MENNMMYKLANNVYRMQPYTIKINKNIVIDLNLV